jgi:hypothetical protein
MGPYSLEARERSRTHKIISPNRATTYGVGIQFRISFTFCIKFFFLIINSNII